MLQVKKSLKIMVKEYYLDITIGGEGIIDPTLELVRHFGLEKWLEGKILGAWRLELELACRNGVQNSEIINIKNNKISI